MSVFRTPDESVAEDLWTALHPVVSRAPKGRARAKRPNVVPVDDSKKLFQRKKGVVRLEEGLLPFYHCRHGEIPSTVRALIESVARRGRGPGASYLDHYPWYQGRDLDIPRDAFSSHLSRLALQLAERCRDAGVDVLGLGAIPFEVAEFNDLVRRMEKKSKVSFSAVSELLRRVWRQFPDEPTLVVIDRQGGRSHYAQLLFDAVKPRGVSIDEETNERSAY